MQTLGAIGITVLNIIFIIQDFWATCACPEKQRGLWIHSTEYIFLLFTIFEQLCACPEKQSCPGIQILANWNNLIQIRL